MKKSFFCHSHPLIVSLFGDVALLRFRSESGNGGLNIGSGFDPL
jgi:hypothetical protein